MSDRKPKKVGDTVYFSMAVLLGPTQRIEGKIITKLSALHYVVEYTAPGGHKQAGQKVTKRLTDSFLE